MRGVGADAHVLSRVRDEDAIIVSSGPTCFADESDIFQQFVGAQAAASTGISSVSSTGKLIGISLAR